MVTKATYPVHLTSVLFESGHNFLDTNFLLKQHNAIFLMGFGLTRKQKTLNTPHQGGAIELLALICLKVEFFSFFFFFFYFGGW